jgi:hypothetical protein
MKRRAMLVIASAMVAIATTSQAGTLHEDCPGVLIKQAGGSTDVAEQGISDTYTIRLVTAPTADVTVTVDPDDQAEVNGNGAGNSDDLTFTTSDWGTAQTVTVTAIYDAVAEGLHTSTITHTAASTDTNYNGISIGDVVANVTDPNPIITDQPDDVYTTAGQDADYYVGAINPREGGNPTGLTFKWYKYVSGGADTLEETNVDDGNFTISSVTPSDTGTYYCVVEGIANGNSYATTTDYVKLGIYDPDDDLDIYVATDGDDYDIGFTIGSPLATITEARDTIRALDSLPTGGVTVWIRGGNYYQTTPLSFDDSDSAGTGYTTTYRNYPGEEPVIIGGTPVTGWQLDSGSVYKADVGIGTEFYCLFENNQRRTMAREPDSSYNTIETGA